MLLIYVSIVKVQSQNSELKSLENSFPMEQIRLVANTDIILSGQMLAYQTICFTNALQSAVSDIVYVELVSDKKEMVFKHKLRLDKGKASSDYFLPTNLRTGHYKLIAYTEWTLNNVEGSYDEKDIVVINPYLNASENDLKKEFGVNEKFIEISNNQDFDIKIINDDNGLSIVPDSDTYKIRDKVSLHIKNTLNSISNGIYSLSIKKVDSLQIKMPEANRALNRKAIMVNRLPEMRGELIYGSVVELNTNQPAAGKVVSLSIPGTHAVYKSKITNGKGQFYFNLFEYYENERAIIQVVDENKDEFKINLYKKSFDGYDELQFYPLQLSPSIKEYIISNSIYNQVESAYYNLKTDSIVSFFPTKYFYGKPDVTYILDDFARFNSVKETFVEVIQNAAIRTTNGNHQFLVYDFDMPFGSIYQNVKPLLLMDGIQIQDENIVVDFNPKLMESVSVVKGVYSIGSVTYNGIIDIKLKTPMDSNLSGSYVYNLDIQKPEVRKSYFKQVYDGAQSRVPDFRTQLLWEPNIELNTSIKTVEFYTSDIPGFYLIELKGFTNNGKSIYLNEMIEVKSN